MKFNAENRAAVCEAKRIGVSDSRAMESIGGTDRTLRRWKQQGEADEAAGKNTAHARFVREFRKAESEALGQLETNIWQQSQEDWRAAAWLLSKKDPARYGKEPDDRVALQQAIVRELFDFLEKHVSGGAFDEVVNALASCGDSELDERALPCPG